jgi:hypothetical protein
MNRMAGLLMAGCLIWAGTACRADDKAAKTPSQSPYAPAAEATLPTSAVPEVAEPASADCATECAGHAGLLSRFQSDGHCARRLWAWLTYCPQSCPRSCSECGRVCAPTCTPPLYQYFLWHCDAAGNTGHCGCGAAATPVEPLSSSEVTATPTTAAH